MRSIPPPDCSPATGSISTSRSEVPEQLDAADCAERQSGASNGGGRSHRSSKRFHVARGAWLEVWPEIFIPQGGCRYRQRTEVQVDEGGEMMLIEMIAPGRTASGELFAFSELDWESIDFSGRGI